MRKAMLATILFAFFVGMASTAALLPEVLSKCGCVVPPEQQDVALARAKDAVSPQGASNGSGSLPGTRAIADETTAPAPEWAERMFPTGLNKDFGEVPFGTKLVHRFEVTNIYAAPVEITGLRVGCGCVTASSGKRVIQPGESTTIDVTMDTRQFTGPDTQTVRVGFGPDPRSRCVLKVSAVSQTDLVFKPDRVGFGTVAHGHGSVQSIDVASHGALDWKIEEVIVAKELPFTAKLHELPHRAPSGSGKVGYRLTVTLKDDAPPGRIRDYIYLRTNQTGIPPAPVLVTATVK